MKDPDKINKPPEKKSVWGLPSFFGTIFARFYTSPVSREELEKLREKSRKTNEEAGKTLVRDDELTRETAEYFEKRKGFGFSSGS